MNTLDLFYKNIGLLVANREMILSDSRMAYAQGYLSPLGALLQWWKEYPKESHDEDGNPLIYVTGNCMSGSGANTCRVVTPDGKMQKKSLGYWRKSLATFNDVRSRWRNPPEDTLTIGCVIKSLTITGLEWLDDYIERLRTDLHETHAALLDKDEEIDNLRSFINALRIDRIRDNAYVCLDALKQDFVDLDAVTKAFRKAQNDYYTERKCQKKAQRSGRSITLEEEVRLSEMRATKNQLSASVSRLQQEMTERYNCNAWHGLPLTIDELRGALEYHIG